MANMHILHDNDADLSILNGKTIAVEFKSPEFRKVTVQLDNGLEDGNVVINILYNVFDNIKTIRNGEDRITR